MIKNLVKQVCNKNLKKHFFQNYVNILIIFLLGLKWHQFKWKNYIKKDLLEEDYKNPIDRFGLHIVNSIKIGVNRTIPDHRYVGKQKMPQKTPIILD